MKSYINNNTICAISTPAGTGAIAIIRMSGEQSKDIIEKIFYPYNKESLKHSYCSVGTIKDTNNELIDEVVVSYFKAPKSYTGEDLVEIACHGSNYIQQKILELLIRVGAYQALPGEFTYRAFKNGKLDLSQAEAVADLIISENKQSHDVAVSQLKGNYSSNIKKLKEKLVNFASLLELELDFSDQDVEFANRDQMIQLLNTIEYELKTMISSFELGNAIRNGIPVAIIGKPNVGKSTLLNILLNEDKAIVSNIPGTTRDIIEDTININGYLFRFIDTAGLRDTDNPIETMGIERTIDKINNAKIILYLIDLSNEDESELLNEIKDFKSKYTQQKDKHFFLICNKIDEVNQLPKWYTQLSSLNPIYISAKRRENINLIVDAICNIVKDMEIKNNTVITNIRHVEAMQKALESVKSAKQAFFDNIPTDLISIDIRDSLYHLSSILGEVTTNDILENIFTNFCIGK